MFVAGAMNNPRQIHRQAYRNNSTREEIAVIVSVKIEQPSNYKTVRGISNCGRLGRMMERKHHGEAI